MADAPRSGCAINAAVEAFGDRWSLLVLRDVMFGNRRHFRELQAGSEEGIASNILADRLKRLVHDGLLTRDDARPGQKATYSLTEQAIQLVPVFAHLGAWGLRHRPTTPALRVRAELLEQGGPQMWADFMDELREIHLGVPRPAGARPSVTEQLTSAYRETAGGALPAQRRGPGPRQTPGSADGHREREDRRQRWGASAANSAALRPQPSSTPIQSGPVRPAGTV